MKTTKISFLKRNLSGIVTKVVEEKEIISIKTQKGNAIIIPESFYNALVETIYLASQPGLLDKILSGENEDIDLMSLFNSKEEWPSA